MCSFQRTTHTSPRSSQIIVQEMRELLKKGKKGALVCRECGVLLCTLSLSLSPFLSGSIQGPYIFLGHGIGSLEALLYSSEFPNEIAGLLLVDPISNETLGTEAGLAATRQQLQDVRSKAEILSYSAALGLHRYAIHPDEASVLSLPSKLRMWAKSDRNRFVCVRVCECLYIYIYINMQVHICAKVCG